jgi:glycosyltransferase involved in cell wall biosynthesis
MTPAAFAISGDVNLPTGGYAYDRRILALLAAHGVDVEHVPLPGGFPDPSPCDLLQARRLLTAIGGKVALIDGLAYGAMPAELIAGLQAPIIALVHHPLYLEAGLGAPRREALCALEKAALALARRVVVTSGVTARTLHAQFAVPTDKITVAEPGTDPGPRARGSAGVDLQLLSVGAIVPRKAHATLIRALAPLKEHRWHLTIAGPTDRSKEALAAVMTAIEDAGLQRRICLLGPVDHCRLAEFYARADAFVMPSLYEGYGMALGEAMARGLAIVCTTGGAAAETVPEGAAIKVPPGDAPALTAALRGLLTDAQLRRRLADAAWAAGQMLPRWHETARRIARVIKDVAGAERVRERS